MATKKSNEASQSALQKLTDEFLSQEEALRTPSKKGAERQHRLNRLLARERIEKLLDKDSPWFELGIWAAHEMYDEWGKVPAAGVVSGIGKVESRWVLIIAMMRR